METREQNRVRIWGDALCIYETSHTYLIQGSSTDPQTRVSNFSRGARGGPWVPVSYKASSHESNTGQTVEDLLPEAAGLCLWLLKWYFFKNTGSRNPPPGVLIHDIYRKARPLLSLISSVVDSEAYQSLKPTNTYLLIHTFILRTCTC